MRTKTKVISIRFNSKDLQQTDRLAESSGKPRGTLIRELWLEFLNRQVEAS